MSSLGEPSDAHFQQKGSKRVPGWIPIAAFAGTSLALAIPLVVLARQRRTVLRKALNESTAAPRRRVGTTNPGHLGRKSVPASSDAKADSAVEFSSPGTGELLSAISRVDFSTAIYAGKAFGIATGIVTVSAVVLTFGVKALMGVQDTREFAQRMRMAIWTRLPGLTTQIHRPLEEDDDGVPIADSQEPDPEWNWEDAEKRLQGAYDKGGFPAWLKTAAKEMGEELKVERARRQKKYERAERKESLS
ncbi:hypothetical protein Hypma_004571 [Hypsizygus marmoreus]|uniref:Uncharacterized protein n=1 Tax=Hypsizygus marmoreus TaxID=39966 RepID=A0A369K0L3_HYPMA|nr:hypothetical protein Hypma_004571 [Hypsizygus marmoreus]